MVSIKQPKTKFIKHESELNQTAYNDTLKFTKIVNERTIANKVIVCLLSTLYNYIVLIAKPILFVNFFYYDTEIKR